MGDKRKRIFLFATVAVLVGTFLAAGISLAFNTSRPSVRAAESDYTFKTCLVISSINQYYNTGFTFNGNTDGWEVTYQPPQGTSDGTMPFTSYYSDNDREKCSGFYYCEWRKEAVAYPLRNSLGVPASDRTAHTYRFYQKKYYTDDKLVDDRSITNFNVDTKTMMLGRSHNKDWGANGGRIYGAKLWRNGELVHDYQPAVRKSDNIAGVYDKVTGEFKTSQGSENFIAEDGILVSEIYNNPIGVQTLYNYMSGKQATYADIDALATQKLTSANL